jgi:hypothetical protein
MWNFSDDAGIHPKSYRRLKMEVFPGDDIPIDYIERWISELIDAGLIIEYTVNGKDYWQVTGWKHQKIDKPTYRHPTPILVNECLEVYNPILNDYSTNVRRVIDEPSPPEGNGKEGRGEDKDICKISSEISQVSLKDSDCTDTNVSLMQDVALNTSFGQIFEVFEHWKSVMKHPGAKFDNKRKQKIIFALKLGFSAEQLKKAINGCSKSSFHMGKNDRQTKYDGIDLIFEDAGHIEKFMDCASEDHTRNDLPRAMSEKQRMLIGAL